MTGQHLPTLSAIGTTQLAETAAVSAWPFFIQPSYNKAVTDGAKSTLFELCAIDARCRSCGLA